jgi:hypothetical protein
VVFVKPDYWAVLDRLEGEGEHTVESLLHFTPAMLELSPATGQLRTRDAGQANLGVLSFADGPLKLSSVEGQENPVQGWIATGYGAKIPVPVAVFSLRATLPVSMGYVLVPEPRDQPLEARVEDRTGRKDGGTRILAISRGETRDTLLLGEEVTSGVRSRSVALARRVGEHLTSVSLLGCHTFEAERDVRVELSPGGEAVCDVEYGEDSVRVSSRASAGKVALAGRRAAAMNHVSIRLAAGQKADYVAFEADGKLRFGSW